MELDTRCKMAQFRKKHGITMKQMAKYCRISETLLGMIEEGGAVTHPNIARRIGEEYDLSVLETEDLMPSFHRIHGGDYDPDRYKSPIDIPDYLRRGDTTCLQV